MISQYDLVGNDDLQYAIQIRREIHRNPELGFELPKTVSLVKRELTKLGIDCIESYAPCSVAGYIGKGNITIGLRADMDALPIEEKTGLPFSSEILGRMHACGHDAHTAILLCVARILKRNEDILPVRVKLLFQPSEECEVSGAKAMLDGGAIDDVDCIICTHCLGSLESGVIGYHYGDYMSACSPITITFFGKSTHATRPENGVDAIAMTYEAMGRMKQAVERIAKEKMYIFSYGMIQGGTAHNIIADKCVLKISFRYYDMEMAAQVRTECLDICDEIAAKFGGKVEADWQMSAPVVHNDESLVGAFVKSMRKALPDQQLEELPGVKGTEDFAWFLTKKPGFVFRFGTCNPQMGCTGSLHESNYVIDENSMRNAILAFVRFVLDAYSYGQSI